MNPVSGVEQGVKLRMDGAARFDRLELLTTTSRDVPGCWLPPKVDITAPASMLFQRGLTGNELHHRRG